MEFCSRCGTRLRSTRHSQQVLVCPKCGYERANGTQPRLTATRQAFHEGIVVINQEEGKLRVQPTIRADCPKCESKRAHNWTIYASDDEETMIDVQVFKCTVCGYTWREKG
jgi:DNA-directed RNA polymerase subunit M/transcription elongation factor TFIIS